MRRTLVAALALGLVALVALGGPAAAAQAVGADASGAATPPAAGRLAVVGGPGQEPDGPTEAPADDGTGGSADERDENPEPAVPDQRIIPKPNSGHEPTEAGDRGGALQVAVFGAILVGVGAIVLLARRDVRRSRAAAAAGEQTGDQPSEPYSSQAS
jgi:hypothetical protein